MKKRNIFIKKIKNKTMKKWTTKKKIMTKWSWKSFYGIKRKIGEYHFDDRKEKLKELNKKYFKKLKRKWILSLQLVKETKKLHMKNAKIWENFYWKTYFHIFKESIDINYVNSYNLQVSNKYFQCFIGYVINFTDSTKPPLPFKKVKYRSLMLEEKW